MTYEKLKSELKALFADRLKNTERIGKVIVSMVELRKGGFNDQNLSSVLNDLKAELHVAEDSLKKYVQIGLGRKLAAIFNWNSPISNVIWCLCVEDQRLLVEKGWPLITSPEKPPVIKRYHELANMDEAERMVNVAMARLRKPKEQIAHMLSLKPGPHDELVRVYKKSGYVKIFKMMPLCDMKSVVKELERLGVKSASNVELREKAFADIQKQFPSE